MTTYVILKYADTGTWSETGQAAASSPSRALRQLELGQGVYVAVPLRSWKPMTVTVEQTTKTMITTR